MMQARTDQLSLPLGVAINAGWIRRASLTVALAGTDLLMVLFGFLLAYFIRFEAEISWFYHHEGSMLQFYQQLVFFFTPLWIVIFWIFGLYQFKNIFSGMREYAHAFNACTFGVMMIIILTFLEPDIEIARAWLIASWVLVSLSVIFGRFAFRRIVHWMRGKGYLMTKVLIIGANQEGQAIAMQLKDNAKAGIQIAGFLDNRFNSTGEAVLGIPVLGSVDSVVNQVNQHGIQEVIVASTAITRKNLLGIFQSLDATSIPVRLSSGLYELITTGVEVQEFGNVPLLSVNKVRLTGAEMVLKRALDIAGAIAALMVFLPIMMIIGIAIKLDSSGPIFYRRRVIGVGGKPFDAFKFRTMVVNADERLKQDSNLYRQFQANYKLKDDPRVTRIGQILRDKSLDELPQLFNVLLGQMSLVGPRMITSPERDRYGKWGLNLGTVKPGMTGLWQVSGRSDVGYDERVMLDMHYIRNYSIWSDIYLLWLTIPAVLKKRGAY